MGGGNEGLWDDPADGVGLSPRGRGKQPPAEGARTPPRSIPAWAGETDVRLINWRDVTVYPRVGGGNVRLRDDIPVPLGLSPRGRGKPLDDVEAHFDGRSIPAWAGETEGVILQALVQAVYPRVGGGNSLSAINRSCT